MSSPDYNYSIFKLSDYYLVSTGHDSFGLNQEIEISWRSLRMSHHKLQRLHYLRMFTQSYRNQAFQVFNNHWSKTHELRGRDCTDQCNLVSRVTCPGQGKKRVTWNEIMDNVVLMYCPFFFAVVIADSSRSLM